MNNVKYFILIIIVLIMMVSCSENKKIDKPNIIVILADDMGFSDMGAMGSEINTPNLDALAQNGIRYTQFYNAARCCPTRASLITGLYPHEVGMGWMTVRDLGTDGYKGEINQNCVTIAEVLKEQGYNTFLSGKWHLIGDENANINGDKSSWPLQRGFDKFFGTLLGAGSYYTPNTLTQQNTIIEAPEEFYYTDAISDSAVCMINENQQTDSPFFMYVSYTAPHWPLHAYEEDYEPYMEMYAKGWDTIREQRFEKQKKLGVVNNVWTLSERDKRAEPWENLPDIERELMIKRMAIYAAQIEVMDRGIGRIVKQLEQTGELDNTLIFFLQDNGGCAEINSRLSKKIEDLGTDKSWESYRPAWANASNTPFRMFKHYTHEGGIATPLIAHWPKGVVNPGRISERPGMLMDIMSTCIDVSKAEYPLVYNGNDIHPLKGESLLESFLNKGEKRNAAMFWEHEANRAVRLGDWKLVLKAKHQYPFDGKWELYNLKDDRTEMNDLSETYPQRVFELKAMWDNWAFNTKVFPLDGRPWGKRCKAPYEVTNRFNANVKSSVDSSK